MYTGSKNTGVRVLCVSVYVQAVKTLHWLCSCCGISVLCASVYVLDVSVYVQAVKTRHHAVVLVYFVYLCMCRQ